MGLIPRHPVTCMRFAAGTYVNGTWVEGAGTPFTIAASKQPLASREMQLLPEGRRDSASYHLFHDDIALRPANKEAGMNADKVTLDGQVFECLSCASWGNDIIPHFDSVVVKVD